LRECDHPDQYHHHRRICLLSMWRRIPTDPCYRHHVRSHFVFVMYVYVCICMHNLFAVATITYMYVYACMISLRLLQSRIIGTNRSLFHAVVATSPIRTCFSLYDVLIPLNIFGYDMI
jgi:hypothetical protein